MAQDYFTDKEIAGEASGSILGLAKTAVISSSADMVSTLWNSTVGLLGKEREIATEDILRRVDSDSLAFFNEHKEGVQAASFIGGMVAPQLATVKLLNLAKKGETALGMSNALAKTFTGRQSTALESELQTIFRNSGADTEVYRKTMHKLYATKVSENLIDSAIFEGVAVGTLNAHPYMEDYMQNPVSSFAMWTAIGGGVGGIIGSIAARSAALRATGGISTGYAMEISTTYKYPSAGETTFGMEFQRESMNVANFKNLSTQANDPHMQAMISDTIVMSDAKQNRAIAKLAPSLFDTSKEGTNIVKPGFEGLAGSIRNFMSDVSFAPVDRITLPNLKAIGKGKIQMLELDELDKLGTADLKRVFYRPSDGVFIAPEAVNTIAHAVDIPKFRVEPPNYTTLTQPFNNFVENNLERGISSAYTDAMFLNKLNIISKHKPEHFNNTVLSPTDLPSINAAVSHIASFTPDVQQNIRVHMRTDAPSYTAEKAFIEKGAGVKPTYMADIGQAVDSNRNTYRASHSMHRKSVLSPRTETVLDEWIGGSAEQKRRLRAGMTSYLHGTALSAQDEALGLRFAAKELWENGSAFREEMRKHADPNGNVYLYRGTTKENLTTHASVESYTTSRGTADVFTLSNAPELYKVPVDNIIGAIGGGEREILVTSKHYDTINALPIAGETGDNIAINIRKEERSAQVDFHTLVQHRQEETIRQVKEMFVYKDAKAIDTKFSVEEIAARLNITKETVLNIIADAHGTTPIAYRYTDPKQISQYLAPENKILSLQGNPYALTVNKAKADLDTRMGNALDRDLVSLIIHSKGEQMSKAVLDIYENTTAGTNMRAHLDYLYKNIGEYNNQMVGKQTLQSLNSALRNITAELEGVKTSMTVAYIGKRMQDAFDRQVKEIVTPASTVFRGLADKITYVPEFNKIGNILNSMQDWRGIQIDNITGHGYIVKREMRLVNGKNVLTEVPHLDSKGEQVWVKQQPVIAAFKAMEEPAQKLLKLHNTIRSILGQKPVNDLGLWIPPPDLRNKFYSYVIDVSGNRPVSLLIGDSAEHLAGLEAAYTKDIISKDPRIQIIPKSRQKDFNELSAYSDFEYRISIANNQLRHGGSSAGAVVPTGGNFVEEILKGYESQIIAGMRRLNSIYLNDINSNLDLFTAINQRLYEGQPGAKGIKADDAAKLVKNALNAVSSINESTTWKNLDNFYSMMISKASRVVDSTVALFGKDTGSMAYWEELNKGLSKEGIQPIHASFDLHQQASSAIPSIDTKRLVAAGNGMLSFFQLRAGDAAYVMTNVISTPILTHAAIMDSLPRALLPNGEKWAFPAKLQYDAAMFPHHAEGKRVLKIMADEGMVDVAAVQYRQLMGELKAPQTSKGAVNATIQKFEEFQNSKFAGILTKPADFVETMTIEHALSAGYLGAKQAYPGISDRGAIIFASAFKDRAIGNYYTAQKPTIFQGTLGMSLGLYQTYMWTYAQSIYRQIEKKQFGALGQTMLLQAGMFGTSSMPGYNLLSEFIGKYMSNENYDLTTGTYRALPDPIAQIVLYGTPSWMGPSLYTRGDVTPRIPTFDNLAMVNTSVGIYNSLSKMFNSLTSQPGVEGKLQGMLEALSLQTLSRPIARMSEIVAGESITQKGQTVSNSEDVWTFNGISSRMLAVRPLEEQNIRNALHLNSFYGQADRQQREKATNKLRTAIRAGNLSDELTETVAADYLKHGGSAKGWTAVMNELMARTEEGTSYDLMKKLEPNSPLRRMIKDTF